MEVGRCAVRFDGLSPIPPASDGLTSAADVGGQETGRLPTPLRLSIFPATPAFAWPAAHQASDRRVGVVGLERQCPQVAELDLHYQAAVDLEADWGRLRVRGVLVLGNLLAVEPDGERVALRLDADAVPLADLQ